MTTDLSILRDALNQKTRVAVGQLRGTFQFEPDEAKQLHRLSLTDEGCALAVEYIDSLSTDTPLPMPELPA